MIDRATIDKILDAANIVDVVSDFVTLKRAGANFKGLCPFHDDRTPSFTVSPAKNYCKCFACGEGGSPVGFIMKHEQLSYPDALRYLARKYGIPVEERELTAEEMQSKNDRESMLILNEWARDWFQHELYDTPDGRAIGMAYFHSRGFRDDIIKKFQLGYCPNSRDHSLGADALKAGYQEKYLINTIDEKNPQNSIGTGLCIRNEKGQLRDRFWGRVMWPIYTMSGRIAGFGGRVLDKATKGVNVKYQNSPESIIYSKRKELFGLFQAKEAIRKQDLCYLVEGYTDVMAMHQNGVENVVASSGTALTRDQIKLIHRMSSNITVIFDGDEAGIHASERGIDMLLAEGMNVKLLLLPDGDDPDSFARKHNATEFQQYLATHQVDFIQFKTSHIMEQAQGNPVKMRQLIGGIVESIALIPDEISRMLYIRQAAQTLMVDENQIIRAVGNQIAKNRDELRKEQERELRRNAFNGKPMPESEGPQDESTETEDNTISPPQTTPIATNQISRTNSREVLLMQMIIRYGERFVCNGEDDSGNSVPLNLIQFVYYNLQVDQITLETPEFRTIMDEAIAHADEKDFQAEKYFLNHEDSRISNLAFELGTDKEQLSKIHFQDKKEEDISHAQLFETTTHLLADLKLSIVRKKINQILTETKKSDIRKNKETYRDLMCQFQELKMIERELAKKCGDQVIMR
ncbi:MAG: DNA primase [Bacteroidaceae bacterium]|nr:DNA primase [Bacteroidaceae bacterium]